MGLTKTLRSLSLLGALAVLSLAGCASTNPAASQDEGPDPAPVKVAALETKELEELTELLGTTQPLPEKFAKVTATADGPVVKLLANGQGGKLAEGQPVAAQQVIAEIDKRVLEANRAKLSKTLLEADQQIQQADLAIQQAKVDLERAQKVPSPIKVEVKKAELAVEDAKSKKLGAQARKTVIEADQKVLETQLELYTLRSPINGKLGMIQVSQGQYLTFGVLVVEVVALDEIDVLCFVPPVLMPRLALNQEARLPKMKTAKGDVLTGKIVFIAPQADADTGNCAIKVRVANPDWRLRSNQVVQVEVVTQTKKKRQVLPEAALMEDQDPPAVLAIALNDKDNKKDNEGEMLYKLRKLVVDVGVRDPVEKKVEILQLRDPESREPVAVAGLEFIVEGGNGLDEKEDWAKKIKDH